LQEEIANYAQMSGSSRSIEALDAAPKPLQIIMGCYANMAVDPNVPGLIGEHSQKNTERKGKTRPFRSARAMPQNPYEHWGFRDVTGTKNAHPTPRYLLLIFALVPGFFTQSEELLILQSIFSPAVRAVTMS
jgi:hypothetical protein